METQNNEIRKFLQTGRALTPLDALHRFGCFRLSARIYDLRQSGLRITATTIKIMSAGKPKHVTSYKLTK